MLAHANILNAYRNGYRLPCRGENDRGSIQARLSSMNNHLPAHSMLICVVSRAINKRLVLPIDGATSRN